MAVPDKDGYITLVLFRCGRSQWDVEGRLRGATDLPLAAEGRAAFLRDLDDVKDETASVIYHPSDEAATETAAVLAERLRVKARPVEALGDPDLGLLEGLSAEQFAERYKSRYKQWQSKPLSLNPPEGESIEDARERIFRAVSRCIRKGKNGSVGIVLHDLALGLLTCWLDERPPSQLHSIISDCPTVQRFLLDADRLEQLESAGELVTQDATTG